MRTFYLPAKIMPWESLEIERYGVELRPLKGPGIGILVAFETKKELREMFGEDVEIIELEGKEEVEK